jgi:hypothetical protein
MRQHGVLNGLVGEWCFLFSIVCYGLLVCGCSFEKNQPPRVYRADTAPILAYWGIDSVYMQLLIDKGFYRPAQVCDTASHIFPATVFGSFEEDTIALFSYQAKEDRLKALCAYLYVMLPTFYIDTFDNYHFDYAIDASNIEQRISEAKTGQWATLCRGYTAAANAMWGLGHDRGSFLFQEADIPVADNDSFPHTVAIFYFPQEADTQAVVLDATYGYLFPLKNDNGLCTLRELRTVDASSFVMQHNLHYLPDSVLHQKRFLTYQTWPCNFGKYGTRTYYQTPPGALRPLELREPEHIELLDLGGFDPEGYKG